MYYIFNCNNKNEYLDQVDEQFNNELSGTATTVPYVSSQVPYKSYAYNTELSSWYDLIDDYRNATLYFVNDSRISKVSRSLNLEVNWTPIAPPDLQNYYKFDGTQWVKQVIYSKDQLKEINYNKKCNVAYTGITVIKGQHNYLFETDERSITLSNSTAIALTYSNNDGLYWKVYQNDKPTMVYLTNIEFRTIFSGTMICINTSFGVQGLINADIQALTEQNLKDSQYINNFIAQMDIKYGQIDRTITLS